MNSLFAEFIYPNTEWMPHEGVQRGTLMLGDGDPLSPLYPSKKDMFRSRTVTEVFIKKNFFLRFHRKYFKMQALDLGIIPSIPVLPLSYIDAYQILLRLGGFVAPQEWQGGLNISYRYGPFMKNNQKVRLSVHSTLSKRSFICDKYSFLFCYLFISEVFYFFLHIFRHTLYFSCINLWKNFKKIFLNKL